MALKEKPIAHFNTILPGVIVVGATLLYGVVFVLYFNWLGAIATVLALIPVVTTGILYGWAGGLVAGILAPLTNLTLFYYVRGSSDSDLNHVSFLIGHVFLAMVGILIGHFSDTRKRLKQELETRSKMEEQLRLQSNVLETVANGVIITDIEGTIQWVNPAVTRLTGYNREEMIGNNPRVLKSGKHNQAFYQDLWQTVLAGEVWQGHMTNRRKDGSLYEEEMTITPICDEQGEIVFLAAIKQDVTARVEAQSARQEIEARYKTLFDHSTDAVFIINTDMTFLAVNHRAAQFLGYQQEELVGQSSSKFVFSEERTQASQKAGHILAGEEPVRYERTFIRQDGQQVVGEISAAVVHDDKGTPLYIQSIVRDVTERKRTEQYLQHQATHDPLTNLPNQQYFHTRLEETLLKARRNTSQVAVLFIDLDGFKNVNDLHGHVFGDQVLQAVATRIKQTLRASDILARIGGDEFCLFLDEVQSDQDFFSVAQKISKSFEAPFNIETFSCQLSVSIGISLFPDHAEGIIDLIRLADVAMYQAKEAGKNIYIIYQPS